MTFLLFLLSCSPSPLSDENEVTRGEWHEVRPPRPDLQCWVHWNGPQVVCAPSLTATHGASL